MENVKAKENNSYTVNSYNSNLKTVNSYSSKVKELLEELDGNPMGIAIELAEKLDDSESLDYYKLLAINSSISSLFEALSITLDAEKRGIIKHKKATYFQGVLGRKGIKTKFREQK